MEIKNFLLLLRLSEGIGIHGENLIYQWLVENEVPETIEPNLEQLCRIARLRSDHAKRFRESFNAQRQKLHLQKFPMQMKWLTILDAEYPDQLREIYLPPIVLFYSGNLELLTSSHLLGVVGARKASGYSIRVLKDLVRPAVQTGLTVVSGLAEGVDRLSHLCAISAKQPTIGVIGTGLDVFYPKTNVALQNEMSRYHLVLSEYGPGARAERHHFPERNRIIAGLVQTLIVTEAKHQSGSLITANLALQENRNVLAVPGNIDQPLSAGCNELISAGAKPVLTPQDILEEFTI
ncbi:DNA processing protein [Secundilactobacillus oryzae JCM 18671]|uniref:DNA processing protein n=1 Tax=Secundilactobacillus oryzae JCM 18671 TaxID=1291743 RepID=A0A081BI96_9LACO|nr:DNA-processing protein DprA [Secundilactobacillus oryzae]GAK47764.1 DNA processing protein [Secundilactobacillus oryzae JCM 18671]